MELIKTKFKDLIIIKTKSFKDLRGLLKLNYDYRLIKKKICFRLLNCFKKKCF